MRSVFRALAPAALAVALAGLPAAAVYECPSGPPVDVAGKAYVDLEPRFWICRAIGCTLVFAVYVESNGLPGLQRGGSNAVTGDAAWCQESATPDTLLAELLS